MYAYMSYISHGMLVQDNTIVEEVGGKVLPLAETGSFAAARTSAAEKVRAAQAATLFVFCNACLCFIRPPCADLPQASQRKSIPAAIGTLLVNVAHVR